MNCFICEKPEKARPYDCKGELIDFSETQRMIYFHLKKQRDSSVLDLGLELDLWEIEVQQDLEVLQEHGFAVEIYDASKGYVWNAIHKS
jgi:predicted ArsR family transcriptional regulator